ncbi:hypothetical protein Tsubulata_033745 [Turnera subulata]|uniref:DUF4283 domain-containing protein n=1 Tax=Turnera subulata TaxID=218843 RepID=A0A9Q0FVS9_9ROSI|nr:hypothetical protein Tsubulata_033745 [Turnera subulata]
MASFELELQPTDFTGELSGVCLELARVAKCCLLGRMVSDKFFGLSYLKSTIQKLWNCGGTFDISNKGANLFFLMEEDKLKVITGAPWFCSNCHLVVKEWSAQLSWEQVDLGTSCIWIQVHGLPLELMNETNALSIGNSFGGLLASDLSLKNILNPASIIRLKVALWVDKPLLTGPNDKPPVLDIPEKGYGPWLRADTREVPQPEILAPTVGTGKRRRVSPVQSRKKSKKPEGKQVWLEKIVPEGAAGNLAEKACSHGPATDVVADVNLNTGQREGVESSKNLEVGPIVDLAIGAQVTPLVMAPMTNSNYVDDDYPEYEPPINYSSASKIARGIGILDLDVESPSGAGNLAEKACSHGPATDVVADVNLNTGQREGVESSKNLEVGPIVDLAIGAQVTPLVMAPMTNSNYVDDDYPEYEPPINYSSASKIARGIGILDLDVESPSGGYRDSPKLDPEEINEMGAGQPLTVNVLRDLKQKYNPCMVFLMETKQSKNYLEYLRNSLHFEHNFYVDRTGVSGGLAFWWKANLSISILDSCPNYIHILVNNPSCKWWLTFVYAPPDRHDRPGFWNDIKVLRPGTHPWELLGDFNSVFLESEKQGGNLSTLSQMRDFTDFMEEWELMDLGF